jgi:hypothetical protein
VLETHGNSFTVLAHNLGKGTFVYIRESFRPLCLEIFVNFLYCFVNNHCFVRGNVNGFCDHWKPSIKGGKYFPTVTFRSSRQCVMFDRSALLI